MYNLKKMVLICFSLMCLKSMADEGLSPSKLIFNCDLEQNLKKTDGSCFILGIYALRKEDFDLHSRIQKTCMNMVRKNLVTADYISFLSYFPKCQYIYNQKKQKTVDVSGSQAELKRLVRFLNN